MSFFTNSQTKKTTLNFQSDIRPFNRNFKCDIAKQASKTSAFDVSSMHMKNGGLKFTHETVAHQYIEWQFVASELSNHSYRQTRNKIKS